MDEATERIRLDQARAGMVIASDVTDAQGGVSLPRGAVLRERVAWLFRKRGDSLLMQQLERAVLEYRLGKTP